MQVLLLLTSTGVFSTAEFVDPCGLEEKYSEKVRQILSLVLTLHILAMLWLVVRLFAWVFSRFHRQTRKVIKIMDIYAICILLLGSCLGVIILANEEGSSTVLDDFIEVVEAAFVVVIIFGISVYALKVLTFDAEATDRVSQMCKKLKSVMKILQYLICISSGLLLWGSIPSENPAAILAQSYAWTLSNFVSAFVILYLTGRKKREEETTTVNVRPPVIVIHKVEVREYSILFTRLSGNYSGLPTSTDKPSRGTSPDKFWVHRRST